MPTLYWRRKGGDAKRLSPAPFKSEQEFEQMVFDTPEILANIFLLKRQVRGGSKQGIPNIVGVDSDGNVCVIEMKNTPVDASVIPQVLEYAIWAERNPDSIRSLWLEAKNRPADQDIAWDDISVRVLIIAPSIDHTTLEHANKIAYPVGLIEVTRWVSGIDSWLLVNQLEPLPTRRIRPVSGLRIYDRAAYEELYNPASVSCFLKLADEIQRLATKNAWPVERKFNQGYCGFKVGHFVVFGITWLGTRSYGLFFKVPKAFAKASRIPGYQIHRYEDMWNQAVFRMDLDGVRLPAFLPFFRKALEQRLQEKGM